MQAPQRTRAAQVQDILRRWQNMPRAMAAATALLAWTVVLYGGSGPHAFAAMTECGGGFAACLPAGHDIWSLDASRLKPGQFRLSPKGIIMKTHDGKVIVHHGPYQLLGERP